MGSISDEEKIKNNVYEAADFPGKNILKGTDGHDDVIFGSTESEILDGGIGNDKLIGYGGNDIYIFGKGYGEDVIDNWGSKDSDLDILLLKDIIFDEVELLAIEEDLIIKLKGTTDKVTIQGYFKGGEYRLEEVRFADGKVMSYQDVVFHFHQVGTEIIGTIGDDIIDSNHVKNGKTVIRGLSGNDKLIGSVGDDTYIFAKGYGYEEIDNRTSGSSDIDILLFEDINFDEVKVSANEFDLIIKVKGTDDKVTVKGYFQNKDYSLEEIRFADGKVMKYRDFVEYIDWNK